MGSTPIHPYRQTDMPQRRGEIVPSLEDSGSLMGLTQGRAILHGVMTMTTQTYACTWLDAVPDWKVVELFLLHCCDPEASIISCAQSFVAMNPQWNEQRVNAAFYVCFMNSKEVTW